jgi:UDP-glucose 4-epimerase
VNVLVTGGAGYIGTRRRDSSLGVVIMFASTISPRAIDFWL